MEQTKMKFEYRIQEETVEITAYLDNEPTVCVPEVIEGKPVTALGAYAFEGKNELIELSLPKTVVSIGAHAFYNCRRLEKVGLSDRMVSAEDGAFKNCRNLHSFYIQVYQDKMTCLKNLLSELNQEILIQLEYMKDGQCVAISRLVFPKYVYEYAENTPARIINQLTFGSGVHYRECMKDKDVDFKKYDGAFSVAKVNDSLETLFLIARERLQYPYELGGKAKEEYQAYIKAHFMEIAALLVKKENVDGLLFLGKEQLLTRDNIDAVIQIAHELERVECVSVLLEYKNQHFKAVKKTFEL